MKRDQMQLLVLLRHSMSWLSTSLNFISWPVFFTRTHDHRTTFHKQLANLSLSSQNDKPFMRQSNTIDLERNIWLAYWYSSNRYDWHIQSYSYTRGKPTAIIDPPAWGRASNSAGMFTLGSMSLWHIVMTKQLLRWVSLAISIWSSINRFDNIAELCDKMGAEAFLEEHHFDAMQYRAWFKCNAFLASILRRYRTTIPPW